MLVSIRKDRQTKSQQFFINLGYLLKVYKPSTPTNLFKEFCLSYGHFLK